jgi:hypothetical protein
MAELEGSETSGTSFKERFPDLQHVVRELLVLRKHNLKFKAGDPQGNLLLMAEALVTLLALERFLRVILTPARATDSDTLYHLLEKAFAHRLLDVPGDDRALVIHQLKEVRNTLMHGNFEQAARGAAPPANISASGHSATAISSEQIRVTQTIGTIEIVCGLLALALSMSNAIRRGAPPAFRILATALLGLAASSILAGILLIGGHPLGRPLSFVVQGLQIPSISIGALLYRLGLGLFVGLGFHAPWENRSEFKLAAHVQTQLGLEFRIGFASPQQPEQYAAINMVAMILFVGLWYAQR